MIARPMLSPSSTQFCLPFSKIEHSVVVNFKTTYYGMVGSRSGGPIYSFETESRKTKLKPANGDLKKSQKLECIIKRKSFLCSMRSITANLNLLINGLTVDLAVLPRDTTLLSDN